MQGLLLKLTHGEQNEPKFWRLFDSIRADLDRLYWYGGSEFWNCEREGLDLSGWSESINTRISDSDSKIEAYNGATFWRPGILGLIGDSFAEEFLSFWGVEPKDVDDLMAIEASKHHEFLLARAAIHLYYIDSTSWEIFARDQRLLERLGRSLKDRLPVKTYGTDSDHRAKAFRKAGFSEAWTSVLFPSG